MSPNEHPISGVDAHICQRFVEASAATLGHHFGSRLVMIFFRSSTDSAASIWAILIRAFYLKAIYQTRI
ncbi:hypothetical protein BDZ89DRAFT_1084105, partial [Hymenopellis radicata]